MTITGLSSPKFCNNGGVVWVEWRWGGGSTDKLEVGHWYVIYEKIYLYCEEENRSN